MHIRFKGSFDPSQCCQIFELEPPDVARTMDPPLRVYLLDWGDLTENEIRNARSGVSS